MLRAGLFLLYLPTPSRFCSCGLIEHKAVFLLACLEKQSPLWQYARSFPRQQCLLVWGEYAAAFVDIDYHLWGWARCAATDKPPLNDRGQRVLCLLPTLVAALPEWVSPTVSATNELSESLAYACMVMGG